MKCKEKNSLDRILPDSDPEIPRMNFSPSINLCNSFPYSHPVIELRSPFCYTKPAMNESVTRPTKADIIIRLRQEMPDLLSARPVMLAYLFGSVAEGRSLPSSDVDIALVLEPNCGRPAYDRMKMEFDIAAEIERRCGIKEADVRSIDSAPLTVKGLVLTEGVLLYSRDEEFRVDYEVYTRKMYFDFLPVARMMREAFFKQLKEEGLTGGQTRKG